MNAIWLSILFAFALSPLGGVARSDEGTPKNATSSGAATLPGDGVGGKSEFVLRLGNESNEPDGIFGPFTYGLRASHTFGNGLSFEAGYVLLHEPGTGTEISVLDEAQLTVGSPEASILDQRFLLAATAWKNRMIDLETSLKGIELTWKSPVSVTLGGYLGSASREGFTDDFAAYQIAASASLGPIQFSAGHIRGKMGNGTYRKSALELATDVLTDTSLPTTFTVSLENRYFDFGSGGAVSDPADRWIFVAGVELHFDKLLLRAR